MTATLQRPTSDPAVEPAAPPTLPTPWRRRRVWRGFTPLQLVVLVLATIAPLLIGGAIGAAALGLIGTEAMIEFVLAAGENPGMITFGAMFLASPVQWLTGRSQVRVRKYLGIVFFLLALSNGVMFLLESGLAAVLSAPFIIAGTVALVLALPLFLTSSRRSQRAMGMRRWRLLHKLTYGVAAALLIHVILMGEIGPGAVLIALGFIGRISAIRRRLAARAERRRSSTSFATAPTAS
jgi:sulfoxide reductase heme-binding subunit YedZ